MIGEEKDYDNYKSPLENNGEELGEKTNAKIVGESNLKADAKIVGESNLKADAPIW